MSDKNQPIKPNRRAFLRTVALGGGAGVLAGTGLRFADAAEARAPAAATGPAAETARGYHLTDHIREYYRKAAF